MERILEYLDSKDLLEFACIRNLNECGMAVCDLKAINNIENREKLTLLISDVLIILSCVTFKYGIDREEIKKIVEDELKEKL